MRPHGLSRNGTVTAANTGSRSTVPSFLPHAPGAQAIRPPEDKISLEFLHTTLVQEITYRKDLEREVASLRAYIRNPCSSAPEPDLASPKKAAPYTLHRPLTMASPSADASPPPDLSPASPNYCTCGCAELASKVAQIDDRLTKLAPQVNTVSDVQRLSAKLNKMDITLQEQQAALTQLRSTHAQLLSDRLVTVSTLKDQQGTQSECSVETGDTPVTDTTVTQCTTTIASLEARLHQLEQRQQQSEAALTAQTQALTVQAQTLSTQVQTLSAQRDGEMPATDTQDTPAAVAAAMDTAQAAQRRVAEVEDAIARVKAEQRTHIERLEAAVRAARDAITESATEITESVPALTEAAVQKLLEVRVREAEMHVTRAVRAEVLSEFPTRVEQISASLVRAAERSAANAMSRATAALSGLEELRDQVTGCVRGLEQAQMVEATVKDQSEAISRLQQLCDGLRAVQMKEDGSLKQEVSTKVDNKDKSEKQKSGPQALFSAPFARTDGVLLSRVDALDVRANHLFVALDRVDCFVQRLAARVGRCETETAAAEQAQLQEEISRLWRRANQQDTRCSSIERGLAINDERTGKVEEALLAAREQVGKLAAGQKVLARDVREAAARAAEAAVQVESVENGFGAFDERLRVAEREAREAKEMVRRAEKRWKNASAETDAVAVSADAVGGGTGASSAASDASVVAMGAALEELGLRVNKVKNELSRQLRGDRDAQRQDLAKIREEIAAVRAEVAQTTGKLRRVERSAEELRRGVGQLTSTTEDDRRAAAAAQESTQEALGKQAATLQKMRSDVDNLRGDVDTVRVRVDGVSARVEEGVSRVDAHLATQEAAREADLETIQRLVDDFSAFRVESARSYEQLPQLVSRMDAMEDKVGGLDTRMAGCVAQQGELESRLENVHRVAGAFSADAVALSNTLQAATQRLDALESAAGSGEVRVPPVGAHRGGDGMGTLIARALDRCVAGCAEEDNVCGVDTGVMPATAPLTTTPVRSAVSTATSSSSSAALASVVAPANYKSAEWATVAMVEDRHQRLVAAMKKHAAAVKNRFLQVEERLDGLVKASGGDIEVSARTGVADATVQAAAGRAASATASRSPDGLKQDSAVAAVATPQKKKSRDIGESGEKSNGKALNKPKTMRKSSGGVSGPVTRQGTTTD